MKRTIKTLCLTLMLVAIGNGTAIAQSLKVPAPSPLMTVKQAFALSDISIEYSRPSSKGRSVYGGLVPFGKVWRTGANSSTKITFGEDVTINGTALKAGTYAIYSIPNKDKWNIMFYSDLKLGGDVANYNKANEVLNIEVNTKALRDTVNTFTININDITASKCEIELAWELTSVKFTVAANIDATIMSNIDKSINTDSRPYFQAASYYFENNKDLNLALTWVNKAVDQNPKAFWVMLLKAKIENKLKDTTAAIASANKVIAMAKEAKNDDYVTMAEALISSIRTPAVATPTEAVKPKKKK